MKHKITRCLLSILFLVSLSTQAQDVIKLKDVVELLKPVNKEIKWALFKATEKNDAKHVRLLIKGGYDVNTQNKNGFTPLHDAANYGHVEAAQQLIKADADINKQNNYGRTPLQRAAFWGRVEITQQLIKADADVNKQDSGGWVPLHWAAFNGHLEVAQQLINAGADVNKQDKFGYTPLYFAARTGDLELVQQLLNAHAAGLNVFHWLVARKHFLWFFPENTRSTLIKLLIYNQPILARMENAEEKTAPECAVDLNKHLMNLLKNPRQYIEQHPDEFRFIDKINDNIKITEYSLLKKTTPDLFNRIRNRQLGMTLHSKHTGRNQGSIRATIDKSKQKKSEAQS